jgi:hypothetical protein
MAFDVMSDFKIRDFTIFKIESHDFSNDYEYEESLFYEVI